MRMHLVLLSICIASFTFSCPAAENAATAPVSFPFKPGDRVAWIGSSSTAIGQYCQCTEFLLRTRHPELKVVCRRFSNINMDTFAKCVQTLPGWLREFEPTV